MKNFWKFTFFYLVCIFVINLLYEDEFGNFYFLLLTATGLFYNLAIIFKTNILQGKHRFLSAGFIGVTTTFLIFNGGVIPLLYLKNFNFLEANAFKQYLNYPYLFKFTIVAAFGNIFFWIGYISKLGNYLFSFYYEGLGYKNFLNLKINVLFPKALIVLGIFLNLILFSNGAFGRNLADPANFSGFVKYLINYAAYIEKIVLIGYFILALLYFRTGKHKVWFYVTLFVQVVFALVSGARGPIIFLFILTVIPYYYITKKVTKGVVAGGIIVILIAFTVASEIKVFTQSLNKNVGITDYAGAYMEFREQSSAELDRRIYSEIYYQLMRRLNTVAQGSVAVEYKDEHGVDKTDPEFVEDLVLAPIFAILPRTSVGPPFPSWGEWFRLKVLKQSSNYTSSTTFGMVGYLYLAGTWLAVCIGFFLYGATLKFSNQFLMLGSDISFLMYLAILSAIGSISANVPTSYVSFFRFVIFLPLLFYVIIKFTNKIRP